MYNTIEYITVEIEEFEPYGMRIPIPKGTERISDYINDFLESVISEEIQAKCEVKWSFA